MTHFIKETFTEYHAQRPNNLSSHQLADFRICPVLYRRKQLGLIPDKDSAVFTVGRATHTLILEGRKAFNEEYEVGGPINPKTEKPYGVGTKAFLAYQEDCGKTILSHEQHTLIESMLYSVQHHALAQHLLDEGQPEAVVRRKYCGLPCQIRIDWFNPIRGIVDLKTCDDLDRFEYDARRFRYIHQMAFYQSVNDIPGEAEHLAPVHIIAVEKREPFRCGVWRLGEDVLELARSDNVVSISQLKECSTTNNWTTGYEDLRMLDHLA